MLLLPLALVNNFAKMNMPYMVAPLSLVISFVFSIIGKIGEVNEDPFENQISDVPLTAICNTIERDLLETLGEKEIPSKLEPANGFLF
jgi:ion channel-forming bestrophin family protein